MDKGGVIALLVIGGILAIFPIIAFILLMLYIFFDITCFELSIPQKRALGLCTLIGLPTMIYGLYNIHELEKD